LSSYFAVESSWSQSGLSVSQHAVTKYRLLRFFPRGPVLENSRQYELTATAFVWFLVLTLIKLYNDHYQLLLLIFFTYLSIVDIKFCCIFTQ